MTRDISGRREWLEPSLAAFLEEAGPHVSLSGPVTVEMLRGRFEHRKMVDSEPVASVEDRIVQSGGHSVQVRIYRPERSDARSALLFLHGGGWIVGNLDQQDGFCRRLANGAGALVVSVDYRLAPEHPYPAALDDAYAALCWLFANRDMLSVDSGRITVMGSSAGANLAAALCLRTRDQGGAIISYQVLLYPALDLRTGAWPETPDTVNIVLTRATADWFAQNYLAEADPAEPYASPLLAEDLSGLPPALIVTAERDPLRDEAEAYGMRLAASHIPTLTMRYAGMTHMFLSFVAHVPPARHAVAYIIEKLKGRPGPAH